MRQLSICVAIVIGTIVYGGSCATKQEMERKAQGSTDYFVTDVLDSSNGSGWYTYQNEKDSAYWFAGWDADDSKHSRGNFFFTTIGAGMPCIDTIAKFIKCQQDVTGGKVIVTSLFKFNNREEQVQFCGYDILIPNLNCK